MSDGQPGPGARDLWRPGPGLTLARAALPPVAPGGWHAVGGCGLPASWEACLAFVAHLYGPRRARTPLSIWVRANTPNMTAPAALTPASGASPVARRSRDPRRSRASAAACRPRSEQHREPIGEDVCLDARAWPIDAPECHHVRSMTISRYSLGRTSVWSPERLWSSIRVSKSRLRAVCFWASSAANARFIGP